MNRLAAVRAMRTGEGDRFAAGDPVDADVQKTADDESENRIREQSGLHPPIVNDEKGSQKQEARSQKQEARSKKLEEVTLCRSTDLVQIRC